MFVLKLVPLLPPEGGVLLDVCDVATLYLNGEEPHWLKSIMVGARGWSDNIRARVSGTDGVKIDWFCPWVVNLSLSPTKQSQSIRSGRKAPQ